MAYSNKASNMEAECSRKVLSSQLVSNMMAMCNLGLEDYYRKALYKAEESRKLPASDRFRACNKWASYNEVVVCSIVAWCSLFLVEECSR